MVLILWQVAQSEADRLRDELAAALVSQEQLQTSLAESELEVGCLLYFITRSAWSRTPSSWVAHALQLGLRGPDVSTVCQ